MTKKEMIETISKLAGITAEQAEIAYETIFVSIEKALKDEKVHTITGFGTFKLKKRDERIGRNPATGEKLRIPASMAVSFKVSPTLRDKYNKK